MALVVINGRGWVRLRYVDCLGEADTTTLRVMLVVDTTRLGMVQVRTESRGYLVRKWSLAVGVGFVGGRVLAWIVALMVMVGQLTRTCFSQTRSLLRLEPGLVHSEIKLALS